MVKLISITKPLVEGIETANDLIAYCARRACNTIYGWAYIRNLKQ